MKVNGACTYTTICAMHESMKRLLDSAREATKGSRTPADTFAEIGRRLDASPAVMSNWKNRGISEGGALKASRLFGVSADWLHSGLGSPGHASRTPHAPIAQALSLNSLTVVTQLLEWGQLMDGNLPATFAVVLVDDAMAPKIPAGIRVEFDTRVAPTFGKYVLVVDRSGAFYFRRYRQGPHGAWEGAASNDAFMSLQPDRDGARVVAVMTGRYVPGDIDL